MASSKVSSKRLIVCCDGTWQASDKPDIHKNVESNVTRMCRAISESKKDGKGQQIVYYQSGIGTDIVTDLGAKFSGGSGAGLADNVVEAYNFLCLNYKAKVDTDAAGHKTLDPSQTDEIFMFGFSRGAYTVRALAGLVSEIGILKKSNIRKFPEIYKAYQEHPDTNVRKEKLQGLIKEEDHKVSKDLVKIKVVGVFDTVGSLGIPDAAFLPAKFQNWWNKGHGFHNPRLSDCFENAFHALALDEHRRPFSPTLWHKSENGTTNLVQCWFPGVHINIGGGSKDEAEGTPEAKYTDYGEISHITFAWMVDLCRAYLTFDEKYLETFKEYHRKLLQVKDQPGSKPKVKGWARGMINDSFEDVMALGGSRTRAPGQYNTDNQIVDIYSKTIPNPPISTGTNEYIHPSARIRIKARFEQDKSKTWARDTDQRALGGFELVAKDKAERGSGLAWVKKVGQTEMIRIPEYKMSESPDSLEWSLLQHDDPQHAHGPNALDIVMSREAITLPAMTARGYVAGTSSTLSKAIFGYLPSWMHYWETD